MRLDGTVRTGGRGLGLRRGRRLPRAQSRGRNRETQDEKKLSDAHRAPIAVSAYFVSDAADSLRTVFPAAHESFAAEELGAFALRVRLASRPLVRTRQHKAHRRAIRRELHAGFEMRDGTRDVTRFQQ